MSKGPIINLTQPSRFSWGTNHSISIRGFTVVQNRESFVTAARDGKLFLVVKKPGRNGYSLWPDGVNKQGRVCWRSDRAIFIPTDAT